MERPVIKDAKVAEYVKHIETQLARYQEHPLGSLYLNLRKQIDGLNEALGEFNIDLTGLEDKDDKQFERWVKLMSESKKIGENVMFYHALLNPEVKANTEPEEDSVESYALGRTPKKKP